MNGTRLYHLWDVLTSSYWFIPSLMVLLTAGLALGMLAVDSAWEGGSRWVYSGDAEGARSLLSTVAGSIITVAGVVFSITIVTLTQASSQFGPRLLRNFMRDTGNQIVLGTFIATFIYCLLVLRSVRNQHDTPFTPHVSITVAIGLAVASIAVLIYFIHHVARSLQAPLVVAAVGKDLDRVIQHMFPGDLGHDAAEGDSHPEIPADLDRAATPILSKASGYLQAIDQETLMQLACRHDLLLRLRCRPGQYMVQGNALLDAWPGDRCSDTTGCQLRDAFLLGQERTSEQDIEHAINQMVEIAVRALSPGINDPFTAMTCIDWLGAALAHLGRRALPGGHRYDRDGRLRAIVPATDFPGLTDAAFNQIRQAAGGHVGVSIRLLETIAIVSGQMRSDIERAALRHHAQLIHEDSTRRTTQPRDLADLHHRYQRAKDSLRPGA